MSLETTTVIADYRTRIIDGLQYDSYAFYGQGPNWRLLGGGVMGLVIPEGGGVDVLYQNHLDEETIVHAHGLTPPSTLDGVPYLSAVPLFPNRTAHYEYGLDGSRNNGTYFIHSHYGFQSGNGLVAPVFVEGVAPSYPLAGELQTAEDIFVILEDVCPAASEEFLAKHVGAKRRPGLPEESGQLGDCSSWATFLELAVGFNETNGEPPVSCPGVDAATGSDVVYKAFLANGATNKAPVFVLQQDPLPEYIVLHVINACGMTNMRVDLPFAATVTAVDGQLVQPYQASQFWVSVAQRVDLLVDVNAVLSSVPVTNGVKWFAATSYTESTVASVPAPLVVVLQGSLDNTTRAAITNVIRSTTVVTGMMTAVQERELRAFSPLQPSAQQPAVTFTAKLTGDNGFRGINYESYRLPPTEPLPFQPNPNPFLVQYGDWVEIAIENNNPDGHPMHLHGHNFQVLSIDGEAFSGAVRDVVLVPGGCHNVTIGFSADNPGIWAFHCHLEFHLAAGMLTTVEYIPGNLATVMPPAVDATSVQVGERCTACSGGSCQQTTVATNQCVAYYSCSQQQQLYMLAKPSGVTGNFVGLLYHDNQCTQAAWSSDLSCHSCDDRSGDCSPLYLFCS